MCFINDKIDTPQTKRILLSKEIPVVTKGLRKLDLAFFQTESVTTNYVYHKIFLNS